MGDRHPDDAVVTSGSHPDSARATDGTLRWKQRGAPPVTLEGVGEQAAHLRRLLDRKAAGSGADDVERPLAEIAARAGFRWRELEEYVAAHVAAFDARFAEWRTACSAWAEAAESDRATWLRWWIADAWKSVPVRAPGALPLFLASGAFAERRRRAVERYGEDLGRKAVRWRERHATKVVHAPPASRGREVADRLVAAGLAEAGPSIPMPDLLDALDTRPVAEFASALGVERGRTKAVTIVHLCRAGADAAALAAHAPVADLVRLVRLPPPLDEIPLEAFDAPARVPEVTASLLASTWAAGVRVASAIENASGPATQVELRCADGDEACPHCRRQAGRRFPVDRRPRMPLHPGCRCVLRVIAGPDAT